MKQPGRFEMRLADGAVNPYVLQAGLLVAGLDGLANQTSPGKRWDIDMYGEGHKARNAAKLPLNLLDASRAFEKNKTRRAGLGDEFVRAYVKLKTGEWNAYPSRLSEWEREHTLDR